MQNVTNSNHIYKETKKILVFRELKKMHVCPII